MIVMKNEIENKKYCVYIHTSPSDKKYVGQTCQDPEVRWGKNGNRYLHKRNGKYTHPALANAIIKYGWDCFDHEIVASNLTKEEADDLERLLIKELDTMNPRLGYNCMSGGSNGRHSEESRKKMSESRKGRKLSEETKMKMVESANRGEDHYLYGKHLPEETRKKISETLKGNIISENTRKKISESLKGKRTGADSPYARKVDQYDLQGNFIKTWDSIVDAENELHVRGISSCCNDDNHVVKTVGGYIWRYFGDELTEEHINWCNRNKRSRYIVQYSLSGEPICIFDGITKAELETGINHSNISACCSGRKRTAGGFIWKYYDDVEESA